MDSQIEHTAATVALDVLGEHAYRVPLKPTAEHWTAFAVLKLRRRVMPHAPINRGEEAFMAALEHLSHHPAFREQAERKIIDCERTFRQAEIDGLQAELKAIDPQQWGLSDVEQKRALLVGGLVQVERGVDRAVYDHARERAALELTTGTLALDGFLQDMRRMKDLAAQIERAKDELANLATTAERAAKERSSRVKAAKQERAALRKREPMTV